MNIIKNNIKFYLLLKDYINQNYQNEIIYSNLNNLSLNNEKIFTCDELKLYEFKKNTMYYKLKNRLQNIYFFIFL